MSESSPEQYPLPLSSLRLLVSPLRLVSAALWGAVQHYGLLEHFLTAVQDHIPGVFTRSERLQLILGLRAKIVLEMCNYDDLCYRQNIEPHLMKMDDLLMEHADEETCLKMKESFDHFSKAIYSLLDDPHKRDLCFQNTSEFALKFDSSLQTLVRKLLLYLENVLPVPSLDQTSLWLGFNPSVFKECEDILTQPEPLKNLIQHQKLSCTFPPGDHYDDLIVPDLQAEDEATQFQTSHTSGDELKYVSSVEVTLSPFCDYGEEDNNSDVMQGQSDYKDSFRCPECGLMFDTLHFCPAHSISGCIEEKNQDSLNSENNTLTLEEEQVSINTVSTSEHDFHSDNIDCLLCGQLYTHQTLLEHQKVCVVRYEEERRTTAPCSFPLQQVRSSDVSGSLICNRSCRIKTCSICGRAFTSSADLTSHMRTHTEEDTHVCEEYAEDFDNYMKYTFLQDNGCSDYTQMLLDQKCVKQCVVVLRRLSPSIELSLVKKEIDENILKENFEKHLESFKEPLKMPGMDSGFSYTLIEPCTLSSPACVTDDSVETDSDPQIRRQIAENSTSKLSTLKCTLCDKTFSEILPMRSHYFHLHGVKRSFQCPSCNRTFVSLNDLVNHHQNKRLFQCDTCKRCFVNLTLLKKHKVRFKNACAKPHICETCGKSCFNAGVLKLHQKVHQKKESTICTVCGKNLSTKFTLKVHMNRHTGGFQCSICHKIFFQKTALRRHMNKHNGHEPYLCEICGKGCPTPAYLKIHMVKHTEERPFECDQCGQSFKRKRNLKVHVISKHSELQPYACSACGKAIKYSSVLYERMMKPSGAQRHVCTKCGGGFARKYQRRMHRENKCF